MFSGIIQGIGTIIELKKDSDGVNINIDASTLESMPKQKVGDSIAVNGACLTITSHSHSSFSAEVSNTTLKLTNLSHLNVGSQVNLEPALTLQEAVNGHLVSGHVDHICHLEEIKTSGFSRRLTISIADELCQYAVARGSITLDGISLTINDIEGNKVSVTIIPHTWNHTIAHQWKVGTAINLEVDLIARYIERLCRKN